MGYSDRQREWPGSTNDIHGNKIKGSHLHTAQASSHADRVGEANNKRKRKVVGKPNKSHKESEIISLQLTRASVFGSRKSEERAEARLK